MIQDITIDGMASLVGGEYGIVTIDGIGKCSGDLSAASVKVDGVFRCNGAISSGTILCDGVAKIYGNVKAGKIEIDGLLAVNGGGKIEADEIECDGMIRIEGEITADVIRADGFINAAEITGDSITIHSHRRFFVPFLDPARSKIRLIEATTVELQAVVAHSVNGRDIRIEKGCRIESIDCSGTLWISPHARVKYVTGNYTTVDA